MQKLNVLVRGFVMGNDPAVIAKTLELFSVERCVFLIRKNESPPPVNAEQTLVYHWNAFSDVDWNTVPPLDEQLIEDMRDCEAVFFEMVTREEWNGRYIPYQERRRMYHQHLRYWNYVLEQNAINLFLAICLPHRLHSFVSYSLCQKKGIPILFFHHATPIKDTLHVMSDWREPSNAISEFISENKNNDAIKLSEKFESYFQEHTKEREKAKKPWYVNKPPEKRFQKWCFLVACLFCRNLKQFFKKAKHSVLLHCTLDRWKRIMQNCIRCSKARKFFAYYDAHTVEPNYSQKYIYVPLQRQPEASTCPMAGAYTDQLLIVQMLSNLVPDDVLLYVKEHMNQQRVFPDGRCRSKIFYDDMLACKNVRFMSRKENTFRLMEHATSIASGTGTAGFEALFRGKPVLLFGRRYYQYASGVFVIRTLEDCENALHSIFKHGVKPDEKDVRVFLRALESTTIEAVTEGKPRLYAEISDEENINRLSKALIDGIRSFPTLSSCAKE